MSHKHRIKLHSLTDQSYPGENCTPKKHKVRYKRTEVYVVFVCFCFAEGQSGDFIQV